MLVYQPTTDSRNVTESYIYHHHLYFSPWIKMICPKTYKSLTRTNKQKKQRLTLELELHVLSPGACWLISSLVSVGAGSTSLSFPIAPRHKGHFGLSALITPELRKVSMKSEHNFNFVQNVLKYYLKGIDFNRFQQISTFFSRNLALKSQN